MSEAVPVPQGFEPLKRGGPYFSQLGPLYHRPGPSGTLVLGLRVDVSHTNMVGITHGGMLMTFADGALGINLSVAKGVPRSSVTVHMSSDFIEAARAGDWLEAHVHIRKLGLRLSFADCELTVGERTILRASAVFASINPPGKPVPTDG
jgi:uncharacterized protein (TIGR00369 family)